MLDQSGAVTSVTAGNIFLLGDGILHTPPLDTCGVAGTRRQLVLESLAPALGLRTRVEPITLEDLGQADELFYCSSLAGIRPVAGIPGAGWEQHEVAAALHSALSDRGGR